MFQPPRNRDASAAVRGYVYQVERTVDHWLRLGANQVLELERGEDIDLVSRMIAAGNPTGPEVRLLEQVKHREQTLTLRTGSAIEALANFHDHRRHNPGEDPRFCFLTNATIGCEQLNPFPNRIPGIALWEQIRTGQRGESEIPIRVGQLRQFLANLAKPDNLPGTVWTTWTGFLATAPSEEYRLILMPYIESYWRYVAEHRRFALRVPDVMVANLESASQKPERERVYAILSAAAGSFRIRGAQDVLQRLRPTTS